MTSIWFFCWWEIKYVIKKIWTPNLFASVETDESLKFIANYRFLMVPLVVSKNYYKEICFLNNLALIVESSKCILSPFFVFPNGFGEHQSLSILRDCRRQLSALQTTEMPLDGAKYGWLLNLQTLSYNNFVNFFSIFSTNLFINKIILAGLI